MSEGKMICCLLRAELAAKDAEIKALDELVEVLDTANYLDSTVPCSPSRKEWEGLMGTAEKLRAKLDALRGAGREG